MGKAVTRGQALELMGAFCRDINWDALTADQAQIIIDMSREERRTRFTNFLVNGGASYNKRDQLQQPASKLPILKSTSDCIKWSAMEDFDPQSYFIVRPGLCVSEDFGSRILQKVNRVSIPETVGFARDLASNASDREVIPELAENFYLFSEFEGCAYIAQMIDKQPNGIDGELLNNGWVNLFYVAGSVVCVYWNDDDRRWYIFAWRLGNRQWRAGSRVFSRN